MRKVAILVLAAGASSRMQTPKQLLKIGNQTLLELVLEKAKALASLPIYCVLGANATLIQKQISTENVVFITNENHSKGLSTSIVEGVNYLTKNAPFVDCLLILLADQPDIDLQYLENLVRLSAENPTQIIASKYPKNMGVPAVFPKSFFCELQNLEGDFGAKEFLQQHKDQLICSNLTPSLVDLDTKEDYENYLKQK